MIRLSTLTPESVAEEVSDWVQSQVYRLSFSLGVTDPVIQMVAGDVVLSTRVVTHYAQTGEETGDAPIAGYLQSVVEALYTAAHPDVYTRVKYEWQTDGEPQRAIDVVLRAALARDAIAQGQRVPVAWLASLVELPVPTLRQYATPSELRTLRDGTITAHAARRWLSARGVAGFRS